MAEKELIMSYEVPRYVKPKHEDYDDNMCDFDLGEGRNDI